MTAAALPGRRARRPGAWTVYRWELRKLRSQKRTYLGLGAAVVVPCIFIVALMAQSGGPDRRAVRALRRETGLAIPLVLLLFGSIWLFPLIISLVAGDIVAAEDRNGTLKTILTRSVERGQIFLGQVLAAFTYASPRSCSFGRRDGRRRAALRASTRYHLSRDGWASARGLGWCSPGGRCSST